MSKREKETTPGTLAGFLGVVWVYVIIPLAGFVITAGLWLALTTWPTGG